MSPVQASCPACGAPITFNYANSFVLICEYCNSAIARRDRAFEDLGKVVDLVQTDSPLQIDLRGKYQKVGFRLTGHSQLAHQAGGIWDEWYAAFDDGRWGWITEAQGRFYVMFPLSFGDMRIPSFDQLYPGQTVPGIPGSVPLVIAETGEAESRGAKGEIPYQFNPGERYYYADLSGPNSEFATIDYSESPPILFFGREVAFDDLGFPPGVRPVEKELKQISAQQLNCPRCAGPLSLLVPDLSLRITCPNCASLLDLTEGKLRFFQELGRMHKPLIPLGAKGKFFGNEFLLIGYMRRSVTVLGVNYPWDEYLLYNMKLGFHWLVCANNQWSYVSPIPAGKISGTNLERKLYYDNKTFKLFDDGQAVVDYVMGEFYWKVTAGERSLTADYICPPNMLSKETTVGDNTGEINWSLGTYQKVADIEQAFNLKALPKPLDWDVGPLEPFPIPTKQIYLGWLAFSMITITLWIIFSISSSETLVFNKTVNLEPLKSSNDPQVIFTEEKFHLSGRKNIYLTASAAVDNSWLYFEGDLINDETGLVQNFSIPIEYYYGVDGGESWSEGSQTSNMFISALPEGDYTLRLEVSWEKWQNPQKLTLRLENGVSRNWHPLLVLFLISLIPIFIFFRKASFEARRWKDSPYNPYQSSSDSD